MDTPGGENPWAGWRIHVADDPGKRYLISDYDWDRTGRRIVLQVAPVDDATG